MDMVAYLHLCVCALALDTSWMLGRAHAAALGFVSLARIAGSNLAHAAFLIASAT
jgi:hypothetical protein